MVRDFIPFAIFILHHLTLVAVLVLIVAQTALVVVPHAISVLQAAGYKLVTVAECLGLEPYQSVTTPQNVRCYPPFISAICAYSSPPGDMDVLIENVWPKTFV